MTHFVSNGLLRAALVVSIAMPSGAFATDPGDLLQDYAVQARKEDPAFKEFSDGAGEKFYHARVKHSSGRQISCATCHIDNPRNPGKHDKTSKEIPPLAPSVDEARFADPVNVEKWVLWGPVE